MADEPKPWELVRRDSEPNCEIHRMGVPGGWLYRATIYDTVDVPTAVSIAFVPRPHVPWGPG